MTIGRTIRELANDEGSCVALDKLEKWQDTLEEMMEAADGAPHRIFKDHSPADYGGKVDQDSGDPPA